MTKGIIRIPKTIEGHTALFGIMFVVSPLLVVLGVIYPVLSLAALALALIYMAFASNERAVCLMFFLLPFANIFKMAPESTSFFTYLTIFLAVKLVVQRRYHNATFLIVWAIMAVMQVIGSYGNYTIIIKQAAILLLVYGYFTSCRRITKEVIVCLSAGVIVSSIVAEFVDVIPGMVEYMRVVKAFELTTDTYRFTALYSDPNFLSMTLIMLCISILLFVKHNEVSKSTGYTLCLVLICFGIQTISKSFLLMLAVLVVLFLIISLKKRHYFTALGVIVAAVVLVWLIFAGVITVFDNFIARFVSGDSLTTGRADIWMSYATYLWENPLVLIFGSGIGASSLGFMAHNTYIDFLYYYGLVGTFVFILGIRVATRSRQVQKNFLNFLPMICVGVMMAALSALHMFDFVYTLIVVIDFLTYPLEKKPSPLAAQAECPCGN